MVETGKTYIIPPEHLCAKNNWQLVLERAIRSAQPGDRILVENKVMKAWGQTQTGLNPSLDNISFLEFEEVDAIFDAIS